jgi:hypothetical protein
LKVAGSLQSQLCSNIIALPFAHQASNIGSANEHLHIAAVKKALEFCFAFFGG